ncbi:TlyA family RNA methyltransferase [Serpentinicella alkaliphila]|uniref:23S rRNA (Cytidine1920-2'-O)/16S rRNA (Cytidine1409-2'-O)-methyltransferase n=1 Tax=Serpentinicella alkaliphila TaxID=1734049 RepID=A0A4R2THE9_9FIRM|nr:TlyA family RNA methyltransferase [Serpentinicella alkaliphila]QUH26636.1 TlyA family RNA methyltransferase [Serpentinicella alkaliphila]TCQ02898.1 23S rRNA (cytidine1920-2'-O)/16S rRNA (cytidine1409-2'-O)-methyltransferase [Serpentinicella alkaliphila]
MEKNRLDVLLVEKGHFETREKARGAIMAGLVFVDQQKIDKPGTKVDPNSNFLVKGPSIPYVSRGGLKLEKAINEFNINLNNKVCMDVGASTGGFTDCMLINGASKVYAIDVGYGQLDYKLRQDNRVVVMERTNIRYVTTENIQDYVDFVSIDVSFISLKLVLPVVKTLIKEDGNIVALIKPQFEAGKDRVGKKGVVKDKNVHIDVVKEIISYSEEIGFQVLDLTFSPVKGPEGNIEYLLYLSNLLDNSSKNTIDIESIINKSHENL